MTSVRHAFASGLSTPPPMRWLPQLMWAFQGVGSFATAGDWSRAPEVITGIEPASDGALLYVVLIDRVLVVDPRTFAPRREVVVPPGSVPVDHVAPALPPLAPGYAKCAC